MISITLNTWNYKYVVKKQLHLSYFLTPWNRVFLKKLTSFQLVKKFPAFYGNRKFITAVTNALNVSRHDRFLRKDLLAPRPTPKLEEHPLLAVRDCLCNMFAATVHIWGRSSIRNLRKRHAVSTGTHLSSKLSQINSCAALPVFQNTPRPRIISSTNFNAQFNNNMYVTLLSSTYFGPWHAHPQEEQLHKHSIWYPRSDKRLYTTPV